MPRYEGAVLCVIATDSHELSPYQSAAVRNNSSVPSYDQDVPGADAREVDCRCFRCFCRSMDFRCFCGRKKASAADALPASGDVAIATNRLQSPRKDPAAAAAIASVMGASA